MESLVKSLLDSSVNVANLASKIRLKLSSNLSSRYLKLEISSDINKLIALIQSSPKFKNRAPMDVTTGEDINLLKKLIKKDLTKLNSLSSEDLGFLVSRLENFTLLINK